MTPVRPKRPSPRGSPRGRAFFHSRPRRGFTLIELLISMSIVVVLAAIAMPRLGSSSANQRALAAARRLASDLAYVRESARAAGAARQFDIDLKHSGYAVPQLRNPLINSPPPYTVSLAEAPYNASIIAASLGVDPALTVVYADTTIVPLEVSSGDLADSAQIIFSGYGDPDRTGWVAVRCKDFVYRVDIDSAGRASVAPVKRDDLALDLDSAIEEREAALLR
jgi:prepilin-type N-terminal cleavage/methylation domain-containing protein